jgi:hypothetical protein
MLFDGSKPASPRPRNETVPIPRTGTASAPPQPARGALRERYLLICTRAEAPSRGGLGRDKEAILVRAGCYRAPTLSGMRTLSGLTSGLPGYQRGPSPRDKKAWPARPKRSDPGRCLSSLSWFLARPRPWKFMLDSFRQAQVGNQRQFPYLLAASRRMCPRARGRDASEPNPIRL